MKAERKGDEIIISPKNKEDIKQTLIWLHGLGDSAEGFFPVFTDTEYNPFTECNTKIRLLTAPTAPVSINGGYECTSWYDIYNLDRNPDSYSFKDVKKNSENVRCAMEEEISLLDNDSTRLLIGGFSQGCAMALYNGLTFGKPLKGIIGLSGYLFSQVDLDKFPHIPPTLLCHGSDDLTIKAADAEFSYQRSNFIKKKNVQFHLIEGLGHSLDLNVIKLMRQFVSKLK